MDEKGWENAVPPGPSGCNTATRALPRGGDSEAFLEHLFANVGTSMTDCNSVDTRRHYGLGNCTPAFQPQIAPATRLHLLSVGSVAVLDQRVVDRGNFVCGRSTGQMRVPARQEAQIPFD